MVRRWMKRGRRVRPLGGGARQKQESRWPFVTQYVPSKNQKEPTTWNTCTTTSQKRQRRKESLIRKDGKADVEQCVRAWNTYRKSHANPSVRAFARLIGEAPSTVRYILNKGTSAGHLAHYLPTQKRWDYYELSPDFAIEESQKRAANKGPVCQVTNFFVIDFEKAYAKTKSVTYALKLLSEAPHDYHLPSRSTVYRLLERGELLDKHGKPLTYKHYSDLTTSPPPPTALATTPPSI